MADEVTIEYRVSWEQWEGWYPELRWAMIRTFARGSALNAPPEGRGPVKVRRGEAGFTLVRHCVRPEWTIRREP